MIKTWHMNDRLALQNDASLLNQKVVAVFLFVFLLCTPFKSMGNWSNAVVENAYWFLLVFWSVKWCYCLVGRCNGRHLSWWKSLVLYRKMLHGRLYKWDLIIKHHSLSSRFCAGQIIFFYAICQSCFYIFHYTAVKLNRVTRPSSLLSFFLSFFFISSISACPYRALWRCWCYLRSLCRRQRKPHLSYRSSMSKTWWCIAFVWWISSQEKGRFIRYFVKRFALFCPYFFHIFIARYTYIMSEM